MRPNWKSYVLIITLGIVGGATGKSYGQEPPSGDPTGDIVRGALDDAWNLYHATEGLYSVTMMRVIWTNGVDPQAFVYMQEARTLLDLAKSYLDDAEDAWDTYVATGNNGALLACADDTSAGYDKCTEAAVKIMLADQLVDETEN